MARRNPSIPSLLVQAPWPVSASLGVVGFIVLRWVIPQVEFQNIMIATFAKAAPSAAVFVLIFCLILSALAWILRRKKQGLVESQKDLASLQALPWQHFEWMVGEAYRRQGYTVEDSIDTGPDGGIDLVLRKDGQTVLVQCKRWKTQSVGAPVVRELFGLLHHHQASKAIVVTCGHFTPEAISFADDKPIELIDGPALLKLVKDVQGSKPAPPAASPTAVVDRAPVAPTPTEHRRCPSCGATMVLRTAKRGANAGNSFWGCSSYPKCRGVREA